MQYVILGAGGMARSAYCYLRSTQGDLDVCFLDEITESNTISLCGIVFPVIHSVSDIVRAGYQGAQVVPAVACPFTRRRLVTEALGVGCRLSDPIIHPSAVILEASIGDGSIVCPHVTMTTNVRIAECCIVNMQSTIGHDASLAAFVTIHPGVHVSGNVAIGEQCLVGAGAFIKERVSVGRAAVIGAQSCVVRDVPGGHVVMGVPAHGRAFVRDIVE